MSEFENALERKGKKQRWLFTILLISGVTLTILFGYTWLFFDELYEPYRSVYPRLSTVFSPLNMCVIALLCLVNGIIVMQLKQAKQHLALSAFVLISHTSDDLLLGRYKPLLSRFLRAAGLPEDYSVVSLKKMNMRHFMTYSSAINRAIAVKKQDWLALNHTK